MQQPILAGDASGVLQALIDYVSADQRVCPQPRRWDELWRMLPEHRRVGDGWEPPLPLILGAWWHSGSREKRQRLIAHLNYAATHGVLPQVDQYVRSLSKAEWAHEADF